MLAWKDKVADRLARLLADSSPIPASTAVEPQAIPFPAEHFSPPNKGSLSTYMMSLLPTSNSGHENNSPYSGSMRPLPPESLPKRWRGNDFSWEDRPLGLSEESGDERNVSSDINQILELPRSTDNQNGDEETSTSDCLGSLYYLTEKSTFVSPKLFGFSQSSLPGTLKGCHWVLLYSAALGSMEYLYEHFFVEVRIFRVHAY